LKNKSRNSTKTRQQAGFFCARLFRTNHRNNNANWTIAIAYGPSLRVTTRRLPATPYVATTTPGSFQVPSPAGKIDGGVSFGQ
jgi:hypothetical protein